MGANQRAGAEHEPIRRSTIKQYSVFLFKQQAVAANWPFSPETAEEQVLPLLLICGVKSMHLLFIPLSYYSVLL